MPVTQALVQALPQAQALPPAPVLPRVPVLPPAPVLAVLLSMHWAHLWEEQPQQPPVRPPATLAWWVTAPPQCF